MADMDLSPECVEATLIRKCGRVALSSIISDLAVPLDVDWLISNDLASSLGSASLLRSYVESAWHVARIANEQTIRGNRVYAAVKEQVAIQISCPVATVNHGPGTDDPELQLAIDAIRGFPHETQKGMLKSFIDHAGSMMIVRASALEDVVGDPFRDLASISIKVLEPMSAVRLTGLTMMIGQPSKLTATQFMIRRQGAPSAGNPFRFNEDFTENQSAPEIGHHVVFRDAPPKILH